MLTIWADDAALQDICDSNGISEDQLLHRADEVSTIEMFLMNFPRVRTAPLPTLLAASRGLLLTGHLENLVS
jgi:hypothetical protein